MATQPQLQYYTLPHPVSPDGYEMTYGIIAASAEMADASIVHDLITTVGKREFTLRWVKITTTQLGVITAAYDGLLEAPVSDNFVDPVGDTYTVTAFPSNPALRIKYFALPAGDRWDVEMRLKEVA